jgi:uncharacterized protein YbjT (DUF2867 family)
VILVAGGTGRLGSRLVQRLTDGGQQVRVLTRDPSKSAPGLAASGVHLVAGDVRKPDSLTSAMAGIDTVVSAVHGFAGPGHVSPRSVDRDGNLNLLAAAKESGAAFVLVSIVGAAADHRMELFRMKAIAEEAVRDSGLPWTIVRATAYAELYLELLRRSAGKSGHPLVFGRGDNPVNFVAVDDVAAVVAVAVSDPGVRGRTLEVGGPENLTLNQLAALVMGDSGSASPRPRHVPRGMLRALAASGHLVRSPIARMAEAALLMDTTPMTFDTAARPLERSDLPRTYVSAGP